MLISSSTSHTIGPNGKNPPKIRFKNSCLRQSDKFSIIMQCRAVVREGAGSALAPPECGISEKRTKRERINVQQINEWKVHKKPAHGKFKQ